MKPNLISLFNENRVQIRAYLTYLLERNTPTNLPSISLDSILIGIKNIRKEIDFLEAVYVLDAKGIQITDTYSPKKSLRKKDKGTNRSTRAYYYRVFSRIIISSLWVTLHQAPPIKSQSLCRH